MLFSILIILFVGVVAFFHYVQGFFGAAVSAVCAVLAAVMAVSYDETIVNRFFQGKSPDQAHALVLCLVFAVVYFALRILFDVTVPGNVRTPATVDKVGAALMGLVAGTFSAGIFAIALQMLPFGPTISFFGYTRFTTKPTASVIVPVTGNAQMLDSFVYDQMDGDTLDPQKEQGLWLPVDDVVINTVNRLSDGSLAGDRTLASIHPDYLGELFGQRLGIQTGARHTTLTIGGADNVTVSSISRVATLPAADGEITKIRPPGYQPAFKSEVKPSADQALLIVRFMVKPAASDDVDHLFRFSTGSIRLVFDDKDYNPIGTMESGTLLLNKPDDFLFANTDAGDVGFDAVFLVDNHVLVGSKASNVVADGAFVEVKRFTIDLSGHPVKDELPPPAPNVKLLRTDFLLKERKLPLPTTTTR